MLTRVHSLGCSASARRKGILTHTTGDCDDRSAHTDVASASSTSCPIHIFLVCNPDFQILVPFPWAITVTCCLRHDVLRLLKHLGRGF
jgi:hypothetical protein